MDRKKPVGGKKKRTAGKATSATRMTGRAPSSRASTSAVIRDAEVRYRTLFESLDAAVLLMHGPACVECNPSTLTLFGLDSMDEIIGKTPLDFAPPKQPDGRDSAEMVQWNIEQALLKGLHVFEWQAFRKDGEPVFMEVRFTPYRIGDEQYFQCIAIDITEQKRAEREVAERNALLQQILDTASVAIFLVDKQGRITHANRRMAEMFLCSMSELIGSEYVDHVHPAERDAGRKKMLALLASEIQFVDLERHYWRKDGSEFWGHLAGRRFQDISGKELGLIGVITDISERKRAEMGLRDSEAKYRRLYNETPVMMHSIDRNAAVVDVNDHWLKVMGYERHEVIGRNVNDFYTPESAKYGREVVQPDFFRNGFVKDISYQFVKKNGEIIDVLLSSIGERDESGLVVRSQSVIENVTERKRAADALYQSEVLFRQTMEFLPTPIGIADAGGGIIHYNAAFTEHYGYRKEDIPTVSDWIVAAYPDPVYRAEAVRQWDADVATAVQSRASTPAREYLITCKDGAQRNVEIIMRPLGDRWIAVFTDITDRKRTEDALLRNERMLQTIIDAEPACVKLLDRDANLLLMNRAGLEMIQAESLEQVKGQCVCPMIGSKDVGAFMDLTRRVFQGGSGELIFEMKGIKGRRLWMETHAVPLRNERNEIIALLGVTRDITEKKKAAEALRASEERFRDLAEFLPMTVFEADVQGRFSYVNRAALETFGYSRSDVDNGLHISQVIAPEDRERAAGAFVQRLSGQLDGYLEYRGLRKDGTTFPITVASTPIMEQGKPAGLRGIVTDLTQRRELEEERLKTQKLESIGTLAGGIAHDFNNLLQGVFGYISMAKLTLDQKDKSLAMLTQAEKALHQSVNLTTQLLTFSKGGKPVKRAIRLRQVIEDAVRFALSGSNVDNRLAIGSDLLPVEADAGQIGQVVQNIVLNADQAMPVGGLIEVTARNSREREGFVEIVIRDTGIGIVPEHLARIFDPYFTTKERGSGLGLATSYSIVKNHGGTIEVASEPGKGSVFTVFLPVARTGEPAEPPPLPADVPGRKGRVLVMDDEPIVRAVAAELLAILGQEAEFAEHGAAAIDRYRAARDAGAPFDVVILDLTIRGGMGGLEALRRLQEIDPSVIAIVSSGYSDEAVAADHRNYGFRAFLKKPYDITSLRAALHSVLPPE